MGFFSEVEIERGNVKSGVILAIVRDNEYFEFEDSHANEIVFSLRTTDTIDFVGLDLDELINNTTF